MRDTAGTEASPCSADGRSGPQAQISLTCIRPEIMVAIGVELLLGVGWLSSSRLEGSFRSNFRVPLLLRLSPTSPLASMEPAVQLLQHIATVRQVMVLGDSINRLCARDPQVAVLQTQMPPRGEPESCCACTASSMNGAQGSTMQSTLQVMLSL